MTGPQITLTFDRIGDVHDIASWTLSGAEVPLLCEAEESNLGVSLIDWDALCELTANRVAEHLPATSPDVSLHLFAPDSIRGLVKVHGECEHRTRVAGMFRVEVDVEPIVGVPHD